MAVSKEMQPSLEHRNFTKPEETRTFGNGKVDVVTVGGVSFGKARFEPGWRWSTHVKPIAQTNSCQASHLACQLSGKMHIVMDNGTEFDMVAGDVAQIPPGHDAWVVGNEAVELIDISGMKDYATRPKAA